MEYKKVNEKTTFETFDFIVSKDELLNEGVSFMDFRGMIEYIQSHNVEDDSMISGIKRGGDFNV